MEEGHTHKTKTILIFWVSWYDPACERWRAAAEWWGWWSAHSLAWCTQYCPGGKTRGGIIQNQITSPPVSIQEKHSKNVFWMVSNKTPYLSISTSQVLWIVAQGVTTWRIKRFYFLVSLLLLPHSHFPCSVHAIGHHQGRVLWARRQRQTSQRCLVLTHLRMTQLGCSSLRCQRIRIFSWRQTD